MASYGKHVQGNTTRSTAGNSDIIAAVASQLLHITSLTVTIKVTAPGASVYIDDGTTVVWGWPAADPAQGLHFHMNFGEKGFQWTAANKALRLVVAGGDATVYATATGYFRGHA